MRNNEVKKKYSLRSHLNNKTRNLRSSSSLKKKEFEKKNLKNIKDKKIDKRLNKKDQSSKANNKKKLGTNRSPQNKKSLGVINLIHNDNKKKRIPPYSSVLAVASTSTSTSTSASASASTSALALAAASSSSSSSSSSTSYTLISNKENRITGKRKFNAELITKGNKNAKNKGKRVELKKWLI